MCVKWPTATTLARLGSAFIAPPLSHFTAHSICKRSFNVKDWVFMSSKLLRKIHLNISWSVNQTFWGMEKLMYCFWPLICCVSTSLPVSVDWWALVNSQIFQHDIQEASLWLMSLPTSCVVFSEVCNQQYVMTNSWNAKTAPPSFRHIFCQKTPRCIKVWERNKTTIG